MPASYAGIPSPTTLDEGQTAPAHCQGSLGLNRRKAALVSVLGLVGIAASALVIAGGAPASASTTVASTVAYDTMNRRVTTGMGTAPLGGAYLTSLKGAFAVTPGSAHVALAHVRTGVEATLPHVSVRDVAARVIFSLSALPVGTGHVDVAIDMRRQASGTATYRGHLEVSAGGVMNVLLTKAVHGVRTQLGNAVRLPFKLAKNRSVNLQVAAVGTSSVHLQTIVWMDGLKQPAAQLGHTDKAPGALSHAGQLGVYAWRSSNPGEAISLHAFAGWSLRTTTSTAPSTSHAPSSSAAPVTSAPVRSPSSTPITSISPSSSSLPSSTAVVTSTPVAPPVVPVAPAAGSLPIGQANYPLPMNGLYVSTSGNDNAAGTVNAPLRTLKAAVAKATIGQTIVLRAGSYNEDVFIPDAKTLTIQNYPHEAAWLDGTVPVTNWVQRGSTWVASGWLATFDHSASFSKGTSVAQFLTAGHPMAAYPDQVFVNGVKQAQVAAGTTPAAGQFAVDTSAHTITLGSSPLGHAVTSSNLSQALVVAGSHITLRGFGVRGYATALPQMGTVLLGGHSGGDVLQNMVISDNATQGLSVETSSVTVDHITSRNNGYTGIHGNKANGLTLKKSLMSGNNAEIFNTWPSAGDIKITESDNVTIAGNDVSSSNVLGIWTDISVTNFRVVGNYVHGPVQYGILTELSQSGVVANNTVTNSWRGITALNTGDLQIFNNTLTKNSMWNVGLNQDARSAHAPNSYQTCPTVVGGICRWKTYNVTIANNVFDRAAADQFYVLDAGANVPADKMDVTLSGNVFKVDSATKTAPLVAWGGSDNHSLTIYKTVSTFDGAKGPSWTNIQTSDANLLTSPVAGQITAATAVPLPTRVANALGEPVGTLHLGTF